jgi:hypothetical protein
MPLLGRPQVVAVLIPVGPAAVCTKPLPSPSRLQPLPAQWASKIELIETGVLSVLVEFVAKKPTTRSPFAVVVTDGAENEVPWRVNAPLWESTGEVVSIPLKSRIAPAAEACEPTDQTYAAGSEEVATR